MCRTKPGRLLLTRPVCECTRGQHKYFLYRSTPLYRNTRGSQPHMWATCCVQRQHKHVGRSSNGNVSKKTEWEFDQSYRAGRSLAPPPHTHPSSTPPSWTFYSHDLKQRSQLFPTTSHSLKNTWHQFLRWLQGEEEKQLGFMESSESELLEREAVAQGPSPYTELRGAVPEEHTEKVLFFFCEWNWRFSRTKDKSRTFS